MSYAHLRPYVRQPLGLAPPAWLCGAHSHPSTSGFECECDGGYVFDGKNECVPVTAKGAPGPDRRSPTTSDCTALDPDGACLVSWPGQIPDAARVWPDGMVAYYQGGKELSRARVLPPGTACSKAYQTSPFGECVCPPGSETPTGGCVFPDGTAADPHGNTAVILVGVGLVLLLAAPFVWPSVFSSRDRAQRGRSFG